MKLHFFNIFVIFLIMNYEFADAIPKSGCDQITNLKNIEWALEAVKCKDNVNLSSFRSATGLVRSLVCSCKGIGFYKPKKGTCASMYRKDIFEPLAQRDIPHIIKGISSIARKYPCEAIQIYINNISNVYSSCIAGALQFQGDTNNGSYLDTCYSETIKHLERALKGLEIKEPRRSRYVAHGL